VYAAAVHPVFSGASIARISSSNIEKVMVTDTLPLSAEAARCSKVEQLSLAVLLGEAIRRIHEGRVGFESVRIAAPKEIRDMTESKRNLMTVEQTIRSGQRARRASCGGKAEFRRCCTAATKPRCRFSVEEALAGASCSSARAAITPSSCSSRGHQGRAPGDDP